MIRVNLKTRTNAYYIRWYFEGWHTHLFAGADESLITSGDVYKTNVDYELNLGDENLTKSELYSISGLLSSKYIQLLTSDGWKFCTIGSETFNFGKANRIGASVAFRLKVWAKVGVYTPMLPVVITPPEPEPVYTAIKYGSLYNWFAATDARGIANGDFDVPTDAEFTTLINYLGGASVAGGKLKETGLTYWFAQNTGATNEVGFNGRGTGERYSNGLFSGIKNRCFFIGKNALYGYRYQLSTTNTKIEAYWFAQNTGAAVRLLRPATVAEQLQSDGSACTPYTGNDGKVYRTVKIGTQVWTADNLAETKYANGDLIPTVTDNSEWAALTTGARCAYNNDEANVLI